MYGACTSFGHRSLIVLSLVMEVTQVQCRLVIPAPDDRTSARTRWYKHLLLTFKKNKPSTSHHCLDGRNFSCEVRDLLSHPCPGNLVAIRCAVVRYARLPMHLVQEFNAGTVVWIVLDRFQLFSPNSHIFSYTYYQKYRNSYSICH